VLISCFIFLIHARAKLFLATHQVAVIASNFELAEMIQNYKCEDIGEC
jgi:hypothetical protein